MTLAKAGYYGGDVDKIYNSNVENVLNTYVYEMFLKEYEITFQELNNKKGQ